MEGILEERWEGERGGGERMGEGWGREEWRDGIKMREEVRRRGRRLHGEVVRRRSRKDGRHRRG